MVQVVVAVSLGDLVRPTFEFGCVHLHDRATVATGQVMVVSVDDATSKETFATIRHDDVDLATLGELLQLRVHRRERDARTVANDQAVKFLGAHESLDASEYPNDFSALGRVSSDRHVRSVPVLELFPGIILVIVAGMILMKPAYVVAIITGALGIFVLVVFASVSTHHVASRPVIVAGVSQWAALASQVAGPDATVVSLLSDPNADPHDHEATTSDAAHVAAASVVIENGAGYDSWLTTLVHARSSAPKVVNVAGLLHVRDGVNPHLFYDLGAAIKMVETLRAQLTPVRDYPGVATRARVVLRQLHALESWVGEIRHSCANVRVAATEDVTGYLLEASGLKVVTPESLRLAIGNAVDPSVQSLALALNQLRARPAFLVNNVQTATPLTKQMVRVARNVNVRVINVTETMRGTNYVAWMKGIIDRFRSALLYQGCLS